MNIQMALSEADRDLLLDLLMREHRELPAEIHHTRKQEPHEELQARQKAVSDLIARLQNAQLAS